MQPPCAQDKCECIISLALDVELETIAKNSLLFDNFWDQLIQAAIKLNMCKHSTSKEQDLDNSDKCKHLFVRHLNRSMLTLLRSKQIVWGT